MKIFISILMSLFLVGCADFFSSKTDRLRPIINGMAISGAEHPAVGHVSFFGGTCSGVLLSPKLVLTAAHCMPAEYFCDFGICSSEFLEFTLGPSKFDGPEVTRVGADYFVYHPDHQWSHDTVGRHDVGIIRLKEAQILSEGYPEIWGGLEGLNPGMALTIVGYGKFTSETSSIGFKRKAEVSFLGWVDEAAPYDTFGPSFADNLVLGTLPGVYRNACHGDSGGPAFFHDQGKDKIVGIAHAGPGTCDGHGRYVNMVSHYDWIVETARELDPDFQLPSLKPQCKSLGDFDGDGDVDGRDMMAWQRGVPSADGNSDGAIDGADLALYQQNYGQRFDCIP